MRVTSSLFVSFALVATVIATSAHAQTVATDGQQTYLAIVHPGGGFCYTLSRCVDPSVGVPLNYYATSTDVATQFASVNSQLAVTNSQVAGFNSRFAAIDTQFTGVGNQITTLDNQIATINGRLAAMNQQLSDANAFIAAVGAMHDAVPDPGDRFAIRVNTASVNSVVAGGVSFAADLGGGFRASVNYAGAKSQNAVSGGLNFSFN